MVENVLNEIHTTVTEPASDRRGQARHSVDTEVTIEVELDQHASRLKDVSDRGAFLQSEAELEIGSAVTLLLPAHGIAASAGVRRVETTGVGIEFDDQMIGAIVAGWARGFN